MERKTDMSKKNGESSLYKDRKFKIYHHV